jgi:DNA transposition AAA+ family ATPase
MTLQEQLQEYLKKTGVSAASVARDIGYSPSAVSQWLSGKYQGNITDLENGIQGYLSLQSERIALKAIDISFVPTQNARIAFGMLRRAQIDHKIVLITSESGYGKTEAVKEYARRTPNAILIETDSTFSSKILISFLHKQLGYSGHGTKFSMMQELIGVLDSSNRLIIIDEADRLGYESLELLRRLHDKTKIGMALVGAPVLVENIRGSKGEFAQLYTRVSGHAQLKPISHDDAIQIIREYIPAATDESCDAYYSFCQKCARTLYMLVYTSIRVSEENNAQITPALIEKCAGMLAI